MPNLLEQVDTLTWFCTSSLPSSKNSLSRSSRSAFLAASWARNLLVHEPVDEALISYYREITGSPESVFHLPVDWRSESVEEFLALKNKFRERSITKLLPQAVSGDAAQLSDNLGLRLAFEIDPTTFEKVNRREFLLKDCAEQLPVLPSSQLTLSALSDSKTLFNKMNTFGAGVLLRKRASVQGNDICWIRSDDELQQQVRLNPNESVLMVPVVPADRIHRNIEIAVAISGGSGSIVGITEQVVHRFKQYGSRSVSLTSSEIAKIENVIERLIPVLVRNGVTDALLGVDALFVKKEQRVEFLLCDLNLAASQALFALAPLMAIARRNRIPESFSSKFFYLSGILKFEDFANTFQDLLQDGTRKERSIFPILLATPRSDRGRSPLHRTGLFILFLAPTSELESLETEFIRRLSEFGKVWESYY